MTSQSTGGPPSSRGPMGQGLPRALERVLAEAAVDEGFRDALLADRPGAVAARGLELSESEQAALQSVPEAQLRSLIDGLAKQVALAEDEPPAPPQPTGIRPDRPAPVPAGIRPDDPPPPTQGIRPDRPEWVSHGVRPDESTLITGVRPDRPMMESTGIRPDSPVRGIRPGRVILAAAAVGTVGLGVGAVMLSAGSRPDPPPVTEPVKAPLDDKAAGAPDAGPAEDDAGPTAREKPKP